MYIFLNPWITCRPSIRFTWVQSVCSPSMLNRKWFTVHALARLDVYTPKLAAVSFRILVLSGCILNRITASLLDETSRSGKDRFVITASKNSSRLVQRPFSI